MSDKTYDNFDTAVVHAGIFGDKVTGAVNIPIYQTSTYAQLGLGENTGWEYTRTGNPTRAAAEALIAELEGGRYGFAFSSGLQAITAVLFLLKKGDEVILSKNVYGGTFRVLDKVFKNFDISYTFADTSNTSDLECHINKKTKAILIETPANPLLSITDLKAVADIAKKHNILSIVDNTFMTPYLQRPLEFGIDIVLHSATKYLLGHSDTVAGLIVVNDKSLAQRVGFIQNSTGGVLSPFESFLLIRSIKTLTVRMDKHVSNAEKISSFLLSSSAVKKVYYPGLKDFDGYEINKKQAKNGGAMISFELKENYDIKKFFKSLSLITLAESLGGVESLICHPASMTHASIPEDVREKIGITDSLIRLSVGIENADDLIDDLQRTFKGSLR